MRRPRPSPPAVSSCCVPRRPAAARRPAVVLVLVLLVICITLGLSYAVVRSQFTALRIQQNASRQTSARQAAVTGLTMALKKMHTTAWAGVNTTLTGTPDADSSFQVTYTAGDPSLAEGSPDFDDYPYRVTLTATGHGADPDNPAADATYRIQAVVRLVPRRLVDEPSDWNQMQDYTLFQTKAETIELDIPCRIEGPVRAQGALTFAHHYPDDRDAWPRYLTDLNAMRADGGPDYRPFNGPVYLDEDKQDSKYLGALTDKLGVAAIDLETQEVTATDWTRPTDLKTYQIYQGGPTYAIPAVASTLQNTTLDADPLSNPLGLRYRDGSLTIGSGVTIRGTLFCKDHIEIVGTNVHLQPVELPALYGTTAPVRLPVATCKKFTVDRTAGGDVCGLLATFDTMEIQKGPETMAFAIVGRVVTKTLYINEREPWNYLSWGYCYAVFLYHLAFPDGDLVPYFPEWMGYWGRNPKPLLTIKPDPDPVTYHWHIPGNRIYQPHADDGGLRWDLLSWTENP